VLGFQGRSQLETRWGMRPKPCFRRQPATKIFLCTSEPNAAKWISDVIGKMEIERIRESRSSGQMGGQRNTTSYNNERNVVPLVMDCSFETGFRFWTRIDSDARMARLLTNAK
jgi:type IV secretory pathway TraG/TraD family ATPase VirD4